MIEKMVLIEVRPTIVQSSNLAIVGRRLSRYGFTIDLKYGAIPLGEPLTSYCIRGRVAEDRLNELKSANEVLAVWEDTQVTPFAGFGSA